jgi:hypothetical protein
VRTTLRIHLRIAQPKHANFTTPTNFIKTTCIKVNTGMSNYCKFKWFLTTSSALYNQTWDPSYATNDGQWRGNDHYTIQNSYIASNATNPGICPQVAATILQNPIPQDLTKILSSPENLQFCVSYIGYIAPVETLRTITTISTLTRTTTTKLVTSTPPPITLIQTVNSIGETTVVAATESTTKTVTVPAALKKRSELAKPALVTSWSPQEISAACSKVATFTSTTTLITATETVYTATETSSTTQLSVAPTPTAIIITTSPLIRTIGVTSTTLITVTSTAAPAPRTCTSIALCCMNIAPFSSNSGVWGGICGYIPSSPSEMIGARCISRPASGQCPSGTSAACCKGTFPGQCALGTVCSRM